MTEPRYPTGKRHVSYSEYREWADCSFRHKLNQIDKKLAFTNAPALVFGKAVHRFCESYLAGESHATGLRHAVAQFDAEWDPEALRDPVQFDVDQKTDLLATMAKLAVDIPGWFDAKFPGWKLLHAELQLMRPMDGTGYSFKGFVDAIIEYDGAVWLLDWKTANKPWSQEKKNDPQVRKQLHLYAKHWLECPESELHRSKPLYIGFIILKKNGDPGNTCELYEVPLTQELMDAGDKSIRFMLKTVERGLAVKNKSACLFCPYARTVHCP